ncbi:MAG TPA: helix-turn-helix domain-containing protein [Acidimicrobiales bacterium]|nr:helix-turn-helix domain-containing protein [Acidimicrobiales bacterium]
MPTRGQARTARRTARRPASFGPRSSRRSRTSGARTSASAVDAELDPSALRASADELADGHAVTVLPSEVALSPAEAAELLGLSRPFVVRLLDQGEIPSERLPRSRHRRVLLSDVLAFQAQRERRRTGRQRVAVAVEDAGLPC